MPKTGRLVAVTAMLLSAALPVMAHHAFSAEFDQAKPLKVQGTITKLEWVNPHAWLFVDAKGEDGNAVGWRFEMGAPNSLLRSAWSKNDIKPGTEGTVTGFQARGGGPVGNAYPARLPDGRHMFDSSLVRAAGKQ